MTIYRSGRRRILTTNGLVLVSLLFWGMLSNNDPLSLVLAAIVGPLTVYLLRRPRLAVTKRGLTVANFLTTRRVPWREINGFGYGAHGRTWCVEVKRVLGPPVPVRVLSDDVRTGGYAPDRISSIVADLRARLEANTGTRDEADTLDLGGGRTLDRASLGGFDLARRRTRRQFAWTFASLVGVGLFLVGFGIYTTVAAANRTNTYAHLRRHGVRLDARFAGCGPVDRFDRSRRDAVCRLTVTYRGRERRIVYHDDYRQFRGLAIGAPVAVLLDPAHPSTTYTVHDVATRQNSGVVSVVGLLGIGMAAAGLVLLVYLARMWRGARQLWRAPARAAW